MIKYGLILTVAGTLVCVTAITTSLLPYQPVCGTDGKTYSHTALLNIEKTKNSTLGLAHPGKCSKHERRVRSISPCPSDVKEMCGSDGVTYTNFCWLNQAHNNDSEVTLSHLGPCVESNGTTNSDEAFNKTTDGKVTKVSNGALNNVSVHETQEQNSNKLDNQGEAQNLIETNEIEKISDADEKTKTSDTVQDDIETLEDSNEEQSLKNQKTQNLKMPIEEINVSCITKVNNETVAKSDKTKQNKGSVDLKINTYHDVNEGIPSASVNQSNVVNAQNASDGQNSSDAKLKDSKGEQDKTKNDKKFKDGISEKSRKRRDVQNPEKKNEQKQTKVKHEGKSNVRENKHYKSKKQYKENQLDTKHKGKYSKQFGKYKNE